MHGSSTSYCQPAVLLLTVVLLLAGSKSVRGSECLISDGMVEFSCLKHSESSASQLVTAQVPLQLRVQWGQVRTATLGVCAADSSLLLQLCSTRVASKLLLLVRLPSTWKLRVWPSCAHICAAAQLLLLITAYALHGLHCQYPCMAAPDATGTSRAVCCAVIMTLRHYNITHYTLYPIGDCQMLCLVLCCCRPMDTAERPACRWWQLTTVSG